jgi:hypothetical protein
LFDLGDGNKYEARMLEQNSSQKQEEGVDLHKDLLLTPGAIMTLGSLCAQALNKIGVVTLIVRPDGFVAYATPFYVHIQREAVPDPQLLARPFHYVRPILSDGKARFVAWKDRELWEIEFEDEPQETSKS